VSPQIWFLLGAMLNPNMYLPYASAAATFILFAMAKAHQLTSLQSELRQYIRTFVLDKLKALIADSALVGFGLNADEIVNAAVSGDLKNKVVAAATTKVRGILSNTPLGDLANKMKLSPEILARLVSGDETAILEIGREWGIDADIMGFFVALARKDQDAVAKALSAMCNKKGVAIHPSLALAIFKFGLNANLSEAKLFVKQVVQDVLTAEFVKTYMSQLPLASASAAAARMAQQVVPAQYLQQATQLGQSLITQIRTYHARTRARAALPLAHPISAREAPVIPLLCDH
jgi:hypothetical protein